MGDVEPGDYDALIGSIEPSNDDLYIASIKMGEVDALAEGVHIGEAPPDSLVITFKPNGAAIACTARDDQGSPVPGARVLLVPEAPKTNRFALHGEAVTDASGTCTITGITPGDDHIYAMPDDPQIDHRDPDLLKAVADHGKAVTLVEGQQEKLEIKVAAE
jgi:protocatechuate 3,4-dioxygenase beta subunit